MWRDDYQDDFDAEIELEAFDTDKDYSDRNLRAMADELLRQDSKKIDEKTGKVRGIGGENPILFEEHLYSRRRREIYCTAGVPDPGLVSGMYNKSHPSGRKINSDEQRRTNGASYYR